MPLISLKSLSRTIAAAIAAIVLTASQAAAQGGARSGDANNDGTVSAADAQAVLTALVELTLPQGFVAAQGDANCDGALTAVDAQIILAHVVGLDVKQFCVGLAIGAPVAIVAMDSTTAKVLVGKTVTLAATTRDSANNVLTARALIWTSSDVSKATVTPAGVVTGLAQGTVTITAASQGKSASATVTVLPASNTLTVSMTPATATMLVGGNVTITATVRDAASNLVTGKKIVFASSDTTKVKVDKDLGVAVAIAAGNANVTASIDGVVQATTPITVARASRSNITWVGGATAGATAWNEAGNWNPARVPMATDTVLVPAGVANMPVISQFTVIAGLVIDTSATLTIGANELQVTGLALVHGTLSGTARVSIQGVNQGTSYVRGRFPDIAINGNTVLVGALESQGSLEAIATARLDLNGNVVKVAGNFNMKGAMVMTQPQELVDVRGNARFFTDGAPVSTLTDGVMKVGGHFAVVQSLPPTTVANPFNATGRHRLVLDGTAKQIVADTNVNIVTIQELDIANTAGGVEFTTIPADSTLRFRVLGHLTATTSVDISGTGRVNVFRNFTTPGGSVTLRNLAVGRVLTAGGSFKPDTLTFLGGTATEPQGIPVGSSYQYQNVVGAGLASFRGTTSVAGGLTVGCITTKSDCDLTLLPQLTLAGSRVTVGASVRQTALDPAARLVMNNNRDSLVVRGGLLGPVGITSGLQTFFSVAAGDWTAGILRVGGNIFATGAGASGSHATFLDGTGSQTMRVVTGFSFQDLNVANTGGVVMNDTSYIASPGRNRIVGVLGDFNILTASALTGTGRMNVSGNVQTNTGSDVSISALSIGSVLRVSGGFAPDTTQFASPTIVQAIQRLSTYKHVIVSGKAFAAGNMTFSGTLNVTGTGELNLEGRHLTVSQKARITGILRMQDARDTLTALGDSILFTGGSGNRKPYATAGVIRVAGDFVSDSLTLYPTGSHTVVFNTVNGKTLRGAPSFFNPMPAVFQNLEVRGTGTGTDTVKNVTVRRVLVRGNLTASQGLSRITLDSVAVSGNALLTQADSILVPSLRAETMTVGGTLTLMNLNVGNGSSVVVGLLESGGDLVYRAGARLLGTGILRYYGNYSEEGLPTVYGDPWSMRAASIEFTVGPSTTTAGTAFNPTVVARVKGTDGAPITKNVLVTISNPANYTGVTRVITTGGLASFTDLAPRNAGAQNLEARTVGQSGPITVSVPFTAN